MKIRIYSIISMLLLLINSLGALAGGGGMIVDPSGQGMQLPLEWLKYSPFNSFLIPGIVLFLVNGVFGLIVLAMIVLRYEKYPIYIIIQGILLGGWIVVQVLLLRTIHFLHISFISIAIALLVLGYLQMKAQRRHL